MLGRKITRSLIVLVAGAILSGCGTLIGNKTEDLIVRSSPDGADVLITDENGARIFGGTTPTAVALKKSSGEYFGGKTYFVEISKDGYKRQVVPVQSIKNGWYIGNGVLGGVLGWFFVDPLSNGMYSLLPEDEIGPIGRHNNIDPLIGGMHSLQPVRAPATEHNNRVDPGDLRLDPRIEVTLIEEYPGAAAEAAKRAKARKLIRASAAEGLRQGPSSYEVERLAKARSCEPRNGALLVSTDKYLEVYRIDCSEEVTFYAVCQASQCQLANR